MEDGSDPSCAEHKYKLDYSRRRDLTQVFPEQRIPEAFSVPASSGTRLCVSHDLYLAPS